MNGQTTLLIIVAALFSSSAWSQSNTASRESIDGVVSNYGWIRVSDGYRLRSIETRPDGVSEPLPVVYFIQWLSCDSIEIDPRRSDGWTQMLRGVATGGKYAFIRVDKAGVGESEGPDCSTLDYDTELRHHREALTRILSRPDVQSDRVVLFGASMGATMAPLLADINGVVGVAVWGGGAVTWFERSLAFSRNALELGDAAPAEIAGQMRRKAAFYNEYLLNERSPKDIAASSEKMRSTLDSMIGISEADHFGRPFSFHHQAQAHNWQGAWGQVSVPVFVGFGEYDWFETESAHRTIVTTVRQQPSSRVRMAVIPKMDHHFSVFESSRAAFEDNDGKADAQPFLGIFLPWLREVIQ